MSELKNGEFGSEVESESTLWTDKKRCTVFALPISFTKYEITASRLLIRTGMLNIREDEIQLYRIRDIAMTQSLFERWNKTGTLHICSTDSMTHDIDLKHIKNPRKVKELLSKLIESSRKNHGVYTSEVVGEGHGHIEHPYPGLEHCRVVQAR